MKDVVKILGIALLVSLCFMVIIHYGFSKGDEVSREYKSKGVIQSVTSCRSGKHSLRCRVETDKFVYSDLDITDFPSDFLSEGDEMGVMTIQYEKSRNYYNCRNGRCKASSICYSWMPCYK